MNIAEDVGILYHQNNTQYILYCDIINNTSGGNAIISVCQLIINFSNIFHTNFTYSFSNFLLITARHSITVNNCSIDNPTFMGNVVINNPQESSIKIEIKNNDCSLFSLLKTSHVKNNVRKRNRFMSISKLIYHLMIVTGRKR